MTSDPRDDDESDGRITSVIQELLVDEPTGLRTGPGTPSPDRLRARLVVVAGSQVGRKYPLGDGGSIGRGSTCAVPVEDALVSRNHATITRELDDSYVLRDLGSKNGTLLNGKRIAREVLKFGDRIQVGQTLLLYTHVDPLEDRVLQRQKLEAIGRLGAGVAHDINNLLGAILVNAEYLEGLPHTRQLSDEEVRECLADLRAATKLGADLTRRLLAFARRGDGEHQVIELSLLIDEGVDLARRTFDRKMRIDRRIDPALRVRGDRGHLHQMLMNLLLNARDAMPQGGTLTVTLRPATDGEVDPSTVIGATRYATLEIEDTGIGMDEATRRQMFEPFFTTKPAEKGSGLGLATVMDVVTAHGGHIACESVLGRGTKFIIHLPLLTGLSAHRTESHTPIGRLNSIAPDRMHGTVLVVDDEPVSRRSVCRLLQRDGHKVLEAPDGRAATDLFRSRQADVDLVLMDLDMPELDGEATQRALRDVRANVRVIFLTGYIEEGRRRALIESGAMAILQKPCDTATLRRVIEESLRLSPQIPTRW